MERSFIRDIKLGEVNHIAGYVENIRNKKWMCFIVLRDVTGKIQVTIEKEKHPEWEEMLNSITVDSVLRVEGLILLAIFTYFIVDMIKNAKASLLRCFL